MNTIAMEKDETAHVMRLDVCAIIIVGPNCDDGKELRRVRFVDINDGQGMDISDYEKNGCTVAQKIEDVLGDHLLAKVEQEFLEIEP